MPRKREREEKKKGEDTTPVLTGNVGRVCYSVWEREGEYGNMYSCKFQRMYRNDKDETCYTDGFDVSDLGNAIIAMMTVSQIVAKWKMEDRDKDEKPVKPKDEPADKPARGSRRKPADEDVPY